MPNTHCLPTGSLLTGQILPPQFPGGATINRPAGSVRGIVVLLSGLSVGPAAVLPPPLVDTTGFIPILMATFSADLMADGWVTVLPPCPGINYNPDQNAAILASLTNDTGKGALYLATVQEWWDHVVNYIQTQLGSTWPIIPFGISLGGLAATQIATTKTSTITAYGSHIAAIKLWTANLSSLGVTNFFGTADASTAVAAGSNGVALPISGGVLNVASNVGFATSGTLVIVRGAGGWQILQYTGVSGTTQFTGCTGGNTANGSLATGDVVEHSTFTSGCDVSVTGLNALGNGQQGSTPLGWIGFETSDLLIGFAPQQTMSNNAIAASQPVTQYQVNGGGHVFSSADVTAAMSWFTGTVDGICPKVH